MIRAASSGSGLYDSVAEFAVGTPSWLQSLGVLYTELGLLIFGVLFLLVWWRARAVSEVGAVTRSLLAPAVTVGAYVLSELLKLVIHEDRPCRGLPREATVAECPPVGDWSFPSNHSTIAGAAAVGLVIAWRRVLPWVVGIALLMAFSRVFVGAHYPHDVLVGLLLGAAVGWGAIRLLERHAEALVTKLRALPGIGVLLFAAPAAAEAATRRLPQQPASAPAPEQPTVRVQPQSQPQSQPQPRQPHPAAPQEPPQPRQPYPAGPRRAPQPGDGEQWSPRPAQPRQAPPPREQRQPYPAPPHPAPPHQAPRPRDGGQGSGAPGAREPRQGDGR